jgi:hypothetical protein
MGSERMLSTESLHWVTPNLISAEEIIAQRYPDTKMDAFSGGIREWSSKSILDDVTDIEILSQPSVLATLSLEIEGVKVVHPAYFVLRQLFHFLKTEHPEVYQNMVKLAASMVYRQQRQQG